MEGRSLPTKLDFEENAWYFDEGRAASDNLDINNPRRYGAYDAFPAVYDTAVKVNIPDEHDDASNIEV